MYLLGTKNTSTQALTTGASVNLGEVYRKYCRKNSCGIKAFDFGSTYVALQHKGIYHITATITFTAPVAGLVVFQLNENSIAIPGALANETITTATTEVKTTVIDFYVLVDSTCVLGTESVQPKNISITATGVAATISNVVLNIEKGV